MKRLLAWLLLLMLITSAEARDRTPEEQAKKIVFGTRVSVELKDHKIVEGRLKQLTETSLILDPVTGTGPEVEMLFQDVSKIRSRESHKKELLLAPVVLPLWAIGMALNAPFLVVGLTVCAVKKSCSTP